MLNHRNMRVRLHDPPMIDGFSAYIWAPDTSGDGGSVATNITFEHVGPCERAQTNGIDVSADTLQDLFNQLWNFGFRPKDGTGNSGHFGSLENHIKDLRKITFGVLEIEEG